MSNLFGQPLELEQTTLSLDRFHAEASTTILHGPRTRDMQVVGGHQSISDALIEDQSRPPNGITKSPCSNRA
jgi:hypothetical protein